MNEQVFRHFGEQDAAADFDDRLMKGDVRIGVLVETRAVIAVLEIVHQAVQPGDVVRRGALRCESRRHAFECGHDRDHLDDLALGLAHDEDAAARSGPDKAFLLEQGHGFADRCAADPEPVGEPPLVEPDFFAMVIDVHRHDRPLQRDICFLAKGGAGVEPRYLDGGAGARAGFGHDLGIWYTRSCSNPLLVLGAGYLGRTPRQWRLWRTISTRPARSVGAGKHR